MFQLDWGMPVIAYLFLAGVGAGAYTVSASILLRSGASSCGTTQFQTARYGALLAPLVLIVGTGMIIFELGTFEAAIEHGEFSKLFRWLNLFMVINLSPMSIGSWVLALCILASLGFAYTFLSATAHANDKQAKLRNGLAWIGVPLGIGVAIYTGVLLGAMPARPFWNSPVLALLFLVSALSTGVAAILLLKALFGHRHQHQQEPNQRTTDDCLYLLTSSDLILIGFEILAIFLFFMFAHLTIGSPAAAVAVIFPGGELAGLFWWGVIVFGLLLPLAIEMRYVLPTLLYKKAFAIPVSMEVITAVVVLIGGFILRYIVVIAGQITFPVGL